MGGVGSDPKYKLFWMSFLDKRHTFIFLWMTSLGGMRKLGVLKFKRCANLKSNIHLILGKGRGIIRAPGLQATQIS